MSRSLRRPRCVATLPSRPSLSYSYHLRGSISLRCRCGSAAPTFVVLAESGASTHTHFASRIRDIFRRVSHSRNVYQLNLDGGLGRANSAAGSGVSRQALGSDRAAFGHSVSGMKPLEIRLHLCVNAELSHPVDRVNLIRDSLKLASHTLSDITTERDVQKFDNVATDGCRAR